MSCGFADSDQHAFQIFHNLIVGKSKHRVSASGEPVVAPSIVSHTGVEIVSLAVNFDDDVRSVANEIHYMGSYRRLPPKRQPIKMACL